MLETCGQSCNWAVTAVVFFVVAPFASFYLWLACVVCESVAIGAVVVGCKHARAFMPRWFFDLHHLFISSTQIGKCFDRKPCEKSVPDCRVQNLPRNFCTFAFAERSHTELCSLQTAPCRPCAAAVRRARVLPLSAAGSAGTGGCSSPAAARSLPCQWRLHSESHWQRQL